VGEYGLTYYPTQYSMVPMVSESQIKSGNEIQYKKNC